MDRAEQASNHGSDYYLPRAVVREGSKKVNESCRWGEVGFSRNRRWMCRIVKPHKRTGGAIEEFVHRSKKLRRWPREIRRACDARFHTTYNIVAAPRVLNRNKDPPVASQ